MLAFGLYLQWVVGLEPCPMCIVQRYALVVSVALAFFCRLLLRTRWACLLGLTLMALTTGTGAFVAARQSWLQWFPPPMTLCGRDFYGMVENFSLSRAIPMIFRGSGDCVRVDWTLLGGTIANWSFVCFAIWAGTTLVLLWMQLRRPAQL
jgi:disulfide bond formation protein DsbB